MEVQISTDPKTISELNQLVKSVKGGHVESLVAFGRLLAQFARARSTQEYSWSLQPDERWTDGRVLLISHWFIPMRALVVVRPGDMKHPVPACRYVFKKLHYTPGKGKIGIDAISKQPQRFYAKKGFWLVNNQSMDWNLHWPKDGVDQETEEVLFGKIRDYYMRYVHGMEFSPEVIDSGEVPRPHFRVEQFLLGVYPTPEWTRHVLEETQRGQIGDPLRKAQKKGPKAEYMDVLAETADAFVQNENAFFQETPRVLDPALTYPIPPLQSVFPMESIYEDEQKPVHSTPKRKKKKQKVAMKANTPGSPEIDWSLYTGNVRI